MSTTDGWVNFEAMVDAGVFAGWSDAQIVISLQGGVPAPTPLVAEFDNIVLQALPRDLIGDYNADGFVSQGDLDLVLLNWGTQVMPNGLDPTALAGGLFDGQVSQNELDSVLLNWGNGIPPSMNVIPEPASVVALMFGGAAFLRRPKLSRRLSR